MSQVLTLRESVEVCRYRIYGPVRRPPVDVVLIQQRGMSSKRYPRVTPTWVSTNLGIHDNSGPIRAAVERGEQQALQ